MKTMYIEFYGLPGTGKTTFAELKNRSLNIDAEQKYSLEIIFKTFSSQFKFKILVLKKLVTSFNLLKYVFRRPLHFAGFMKAMFVRFLVASRHENNGYFISDHGLIQTLSQNPYVLKELLKDKRFTLKVLSLFPKTANYIYLKSKLALTLKRTLKRSKRYEHSYDYLLDCQTFFEYVTKIFKSKTISTNNVRSKVKADLDKVLRR
ncbi:MAG: hypothetical protein AABW88_05375 [Nanoarchaeota archaeon]